MSAARILQRAIERGNVKRMRAIGGPSWSAFASFEALDRHDDTLGTDDVAAFLESYEHLAGETL